MTTKTLFSCLLLAGSSMAAASQPSQAVLDAAKVSTTLSVTDCWIRAIPAPAPAGGFFLVKNSGDQDVKLIGAASPAYGLTMLHQTTHSGGMSRMSEVPSVTVPAKGTLAFKPGDYHAMLEQPDTSVKVGAKVQVSFLFDNGEKVVTQCEIMPANTRGHGHTQHRQH